MPLPAAIGAIGSVVGGLVGFGAQKNSQQSQMKFNAAQAALQNRWNIEQWNRENAYNLPKNQIARLREAGINPALAYVNGANTLSAQSPMMVGAQPTSQGIDASPLASGIQQAAATAAQIAKTEAETDYIKEQTKGQQSQNSILASDAAFRDAFNKGELQLKMANIRLVNNQSDLTEAETKIARKEFQKLDLVMDNLKLEGEKIKSTIANLDADTAFKAIQTEMHKPYMQSLIAKNWADRDLSLAQKTEIITLLAAKAANLNAQTQMYLANAAVGRRTSYNLQIEGDSMILDFELNKSFGALERYAKFWTTPFQVAAMAVPAISRGISYGVNRDWKNMVENYKEWQKGPTKGR